MGGDSALRFTQVEVDRLGVARAPHYFRGAAFVVWFSGPLGGIFATAPQRMADLDQVSALFGPSVTRAKKVSLLIDTRAFGGEGPIFDAVMRAAPTMTSFGAHITRAAIVLPSGWTQAWWRGALELRVWHHALLRGFTNADEAWHWLDAPPGLPAAVETLREAITSVPEVRVALEEVLRTDPSLSIESVAVALRRTPRSLQRALRETRDSFAAIRLRVRAETAATMLTETDSKIEAIAQAVGFRSRSHFVAWFRQVKGQNPGEFRRARRASQND